MYSCFRIVAESIERLRAVVERVREGARQAHDLSNVQLYESLLAIDCWCNAALESESATENSDAEAS